MDKIEIPLKWHIGSFWSGYVVALSKDESYYFETLKDALQFVAEENDQPDLSLYIQDFKGDFNETK